MKRLMYGELYCVRTPGLERLKTSTALPFWLRTLTLTSAPLPLGSGGRLALAHERLAHLIHAARLEGQGSHQPLVVRHLAEGVAGLLVIQLELCGLRVHQQQGERRGAFG